MLQNRSAGASRVWTQAYNVKPVNFKIVDKYACSNSASRASQSYGRFWTIQCNIATIIQLKLSHFPFACSRYAIILGLLILKSHRNPRTLILQIVLRDLDAVCRNLSIAQSTQNAKLELLSLQTNQEWGSLQPSQSAYDYIQYWLCWSA